MRRLVAAALPLCVVAALSLSPTASAGGVQRVPVPPSDYVAPFGYCPFRFHVKDIVARAVQTIYPDGHSVIRGPIVTRFTNLRTGGSVVLDVGGPSFIYPKRDGRTIVILKGRSWGGFTAAESGLGRPVVWWMNGRVVILVDKRGNVHLKHFPRRHVDICALLSDDGDDEGAEATS
jgi:hypothetical protein